MTSSRTLLRVWRDRAAPDRWSLIRALLAGVGATVGGTGLFVGAVTLLVFSAGLPTWRSVVAWLIVIELAAFLRSPLRFAERLTSHTLGYGAVTTWRRWLTTTVGTWSRTRWQSAAAGDVLQRALTDTDELQDLWVRGLLPLACVALTLACADAVIVVCAGWLPGLLQFGVQVVACAVLVRSFDSLVAADAAVRTASGTLQASIVGIAAAASEIHLLLGDEFMRDRLALAAAELAKNERFMVRRQQRLQCLRWVYTMATIAVLAAVNPTVTPPLVVACLWLGVAAGELAEAAQGAIDALVAVLGGAQRLGELETATRPGSQPLSAAFTDITLLHLGEVHLLPRGAHVVVRGPSGSGKTTLLESIASLDDAPSPLHIDGVSLSAYREDQVRTLVRYVPADPGLVRGYVRDNLFLGAPANTDSYRQLAALGLELGPDDRLDGLSRGERQRFAVVRALATSPAIIVLDEPTSGLGPADTARFLDLINASGALAIVASHDPLVHAWAALTIDLAATNN